MTRGITFAMSSLSESRARRWQGAAYIFASAVVSTRFGWNLLGTKGTTARHGPTVRAAPPAFHPSDLPAGHQRHPPGPEIYRGLLAQPAPGIPGPQPFRARTTRPATGV